MSSCPVSRTRRYVSRAGGDYCFPTFSHARATASKRRKIFPSKKAMIHTYTHTRTRDSIRNVVDALFKRSKHEIIERYCVRVGVSVRLRARACMCVCVYVCDKRRACNNITCITMTINNNGPRWCCFPALETLFGYRAGKLDVTHPK